MDEVNVVPDSLILGEDRHTVHELAPAILPEIDILILHLVGLLSRVRVVILEGHVVVEAKIWFVELHGVGV